VGATWTECASLFPASSVIATLSLRAAPLHRSWRRQGSAAGIFMRRYKHPDPSARGRPRGLLAVDRRLVTHLCERFDWRESLRVPSLHRRYFDPNEAGAESLAAAGSARAAVLCCGRENNG